MINGRKYSDEKDEKRDLLSNLINANEELLDDGEQMLGEVELIGTWPTRDLPAQLFTRPRSGNIFMFYIAGHEVRSFSQHGLPVDLIEVIDVWTYPLFRPEHACSTSRTTGGIIPTHPRCSPRWPPTGKCTRPSIGETLDLTAS